MIDAILKPQLMTKYSLTKATFDDQKCFTKATNDYHKSYI